MLIGASSADIRLSEAVRFNGRKKLPVKFTLDSACGDITAVPEGLAVFAKLMESVDIGTNGGADALGESGEEMALAMAGDLPLHAILSFCGIADITREKLQMMIDELNEQLGAE